MNATATIYGDNSILRFGNIVFSQDNAEAPVHVTGLVLGFPAGSVHGFHVHTYPLSEDSHNCTAVGSHFNPYNVSHGPPSANILSRHVGDLGNVTTNGDGKTHVDITDSIIQLYNETQSIVGRTVVIHLMRDDGGAGGFIDSTTTGNAGARVACGLIKLTHDDPTTTTESTRTEATSAPTTTKVTSAATTRTTRSPTTTTRSTTTKATSAPTTSTSASNMTTIQEPTTSISASNMTTSALTPSTSTQIHNTTHSAGLNTQPVIFVSVITMISGYIAHY